MPSGFRSFNPREQFETTRRNLPHWRQFGATYFVTFRLADSLPVSVRERLEELRRLNPSDALDWIERYLDSGSGDCILSAPVCAKIVEAALRHFDGQRLVLGAFAIMPNHVHALVQPLRTTTLASVLHGWKSYTAHRINEQTRRKGEVWQSESFDQIVRDDIELQKFHDYILGNPSTAKLRLGTFISGQGSATWHNSQKRTDDA